MDLAKSRLDEAESPPDPGGGEKRDEHAELAGERDCMTGKAVAPLPVRVGTGVVAVVAVVVLGRKGERRASLMEKWELDF